MASDGENAYGKRPRCANYTYEETDLLVSLVEKWKRILECKFTDAVTTHEKEKTWNLLAEHFNSNKGSNRSGKMLKSKWESLKKATKQEYSKIKTSAKRTGGGSSSGFALSGFGEQIISIVGIGITGTSGTFDCDSNNSNHVYSNNTGGVESNITDTTNENINLSKMEDIQTTDLNEHTWSQWNPALLKEPISAVLKVQNRENTEQLSSTANANNMEEKSEKDKNSTVPAMKLKRKKMTKKDREENVYVRLAEKKMKLVDLQIEAMEEQIQQRREIHELELKILI